MRDVTAQVLEGVTDDMSEADRQAKVDANIKKIVAATEKGADSYLAVDYRTPTLLIMGAEDTGISPELLKMADLRAKLPILGQVQSLNVSVAAAIFMYEALRQRS